LSNISELMEYNKPGYSTHQSYEARKSRSVDEGRKEI